MTPDLAAGADFKSVCEAAIPSLVCSIHTHLRHQERCPKRQCFYIFCSFTLKLSGTMLFLPIH